MVLAWRFDGRRGPCPWHTGTPPWVRLPPRVICMSCRHGPWCRTWAERFGLLDGIRRRPGWDGEGPDA